MRFKFAMAMLMPSVMAASIAAAQVASHAPTVKTSQVPEALGPIITGRPVVRVNGVALTDRDLLREEYIIFPYAKQHNGNIPREMEPGIRKGALQMIIFEELVYQEARKRGLAVPQERLANAERDFRTQFESPTDYQQYLKAEFQGNQQSLRDSIKRSLLIERLLKTEVENKSTVTPTELRAYYEKNPAQFQYAESFAIQTISVIPPANATASQLKEARQRAEDALKQAKATKTWEQFGLLAEKISDDDYRVMMGDHKWVERSKMPPEMLQSASKMQEGQVSDLIQVGQNYVVFRMNRHVPAGKTKFEQVKDNLRKELEKRKTNAVRAALDKKLRQNAKIETL
jgi:peptidyl-prolyl cis-trans isomerase SurA